jgi:2-polyprenyl-6-methoxyphenol hydroxylase-like FAD-dependent oxidoreductase
MADHYDAIIVGGRNAGASLAMRLAKQGLQVFLADRARFPSLPQVPSSPILHAGAMRLLDELGFDEKDYTRPDGIITEYVLNFVGHFVVSMPTELMGIDRNYA